MTANIQEVNHIPQTPIVQDKIEHVPEKKEEIKVEESQEGSEDKNWRAFREARKKDRAEREAAERKAAEKESEIAALKAAMESAFARQQNIPNQYEPIEESEDERIEKKVQAAIAKREQEYQRQLQEREQQQYPERLRRNFSDFDTVVTQENLDYIDYHYPELSRPLQRLNDGYEKWNDIYNAIKKFVPNHSTSKKEMAKAEINFNKPKSMSAPNMTQSTENAIPIRISEDRKAANWERMRKIMGKLD